MNNRPYISEGTTVYNESLYNTVPSQFGSTNVLVNHGQHRKILDSTTTSITGQHPQYQLNWNMPVNNQCCCQQPSQIVPQRQTIPDGVTYTFHPAAQGYALRNVTDSCLNGNQNLSDASYQQPLNLQQQFALNQLQKHALEAMLLHEQFRQNPFKLQFHRDGQTNTDFPLCKHPDICMSKNLLLNPLQQNEPLFKAGSPENKPEQLFPNCIKAKQLRLDPTNILDKSVQHSPMQESIEVQTTSARICHCKTEQYTTQENQTGTKKVTFEEGNTSGNRHRSKKKRCVRRHRQVDEDSSSDSTDDYTSDSSISSDENKSP